MDHKSLGLFEQQVLVALIRLGPNAYGVPIRQEIETHTGKDVSYGAVYTTLDRLEAKGFVSSRRGEATAERGGRAKKYFEITAPGERALSEAWEAHARMLAAVAPSEA